MTELLTLQNLSWQVGVLPGTGASVAFGRIADPALGWLDFMRPTDPGDYAVADHTASYVLSPWSNRVRAGVLKFRGRNYQLARWAVDGTAIHGTARAFPWRVVEATETRAVLSFSTDDVSGANFPWRFSTQVTYELDGSRFSTHTTVTNEDDEPCPVGFGHHPYFLRGLGAQQDEVQLSIPCSEQFLLEGCMASAPPVPVEDWLDFRKPRALGDRFIDQNLTGRAPGEPIVFDYSRSGRRIELAFDEVFRNVVFYVPQQGKNFFAVEPVTNANDGFALYDAGIEGSGVIVLEPGSAASGSYHLDVI